MANRTLASYINRTFREKSFRNQKYAVLKECKNTKIAKLWNILFEIDVSDVEELEQEIFEFGSQVREDDYWGREIFVCLVAFLNLVIK